jgi:hypothetical protein
LARPGTRSNDEWIVDWKENSSHSAMVNGR